jgi:dUTP pyrophosphatase
MKIHIVNQSDHALPSYETLASAGMDLRAHIIEPITLHPLERALVKTGLFMELPIGLEAQVRPRSGLALKKELAYSMRPVQLMQTTEAKLALSL